MTAAQDHQDAPTPDDDHTGHSDGTPPAQAGTAVPRSRTGGLWVAAVAFAAVLLLLLIFVLQNGQRVDVSFLGIHGSLPLGVALLLAAVFGVLLVALPGTARIVQLRMLGRRRGRRTAGTPPIDREPPREDPARR
ncbi:LapA family protein [Spirilliplanes yamanashiensis]|uniref:Lipopolysaccharide assembly protein A domain-containing protein n=1 Tax=Spirilliplanes yamanashiensis TaxID=42233 RepID=A0A8J3Y859_9ACTN|nr:lipopolysaccharide assembly protein LapA domain-containing protein [Spirilliplanes yamanashiensis]MDP9817233.1 putative integral membrane protein [Spirilliplanes yamanashiensis]GIJ03114.1 hypothetical protein Sya03_24660 [Spirilliplanes yamanashiensis]